MKTREIIITVLLVVIAFLVGFNWNSDNDEIAGLKAQIKALDEQYTEISLRTEKWKKASDSLSVVLREKDSLVAVKDKQLAVTKQRHRIEINKYKKDVISFTDDSLSLEWKATVGDSSDNKKVFKIPRLQVENAVVIFKEFGNCLEEVEQSLSLIDEQKGTIYSYREKVRVSDKENISLRAEVKNRNEALVVQKSIAVYEQKAVKKQKKLKNIFMATATVLGVIAIIK